MAAIVNTIMEDNPLAKLLKEHTSRHVGYVYSMNFTHALVLTNDAWKENAGGIPHNCFLIAAAFNPESFADTSEFDKEVILLRVLDPANLPQDAELLRTRVEHNQRRTADEINPLDANDGLDPITQAELQYGGLTCRILGTFYMDKGQLRLGSDLENYMTSTRLRVFKPHKDALNAIVNHINPEVITKSLEEARKSGFKGLPAPIEIGTIRYTSTARLHRRDPKELVPVFIQPSDFLARRTAVLGMTRTGKSNTVKTTVAAVAKAAHKDSLKVGQIIFDINGEYANATHQDDGSSIADVFETDCIRYRAVDMPYQSGFHDLRINFYMQVAEAVNLLSKLSKTDPYRSSSTDLEQFLESSLEEPRSSDYSDHQRWQRRKAIFQCILHKAGYKIPSGVKIVIPVSQSVCDLVSDVAGAPSVQLNNKKITLSIEDACAWFLAAREKNLELRSSDKLGLPSSTKGNPWVDPIMEAYLNVLALKNSGGTNIRGYRAIAKYTAYHSDRRVGEVVDEVIAHLADGRIVILDLSVGPVELRTVLSERIAKQLFDNAFEVMNRGETPQNVVIYVEEAHNLIGKKDELTGTWPRIAKEGAKAKIAFVYATQEPSSIHPNILANTENWFVTHLNNDDELKTLSKFYDFNDFRDSLKVAQDVGFARIKTLSSPFVVPTQIIKFSPDELKKALGR